MNIFEKYSDYAKQDMNDIEDLDRSMISSLIREAKNQKEMDRIVKKFSKEKRTQVPKKHKILDVYKTLHAEDPDGFPMVPRLRQLLIQKAGRRRSGIINVAVVTRPDKFSCRYNCRFCPDERIVNGATVDMPRSYLSNEDAVKRAAAVDFDPVRQVHVRLETLVHNGHNIDKIELRVLGGTFSCYPHDYATEFIRDLYYAVNIFGDAPRARESLEREQWINESHNIHIVGLGLETRPDEINIKEMIRFRSYGCTRVELGVQHTNNQLLRRVNRGHGVEHSKRAIRLLKNAGFKVEIHIMIDLPGATPDIDRQCYMEVLLGEDLIPDYLKDYPCLDVCFTEIQKWKMKGLWKPYAESDFDAFKEVLLFRQSITPVYVRVNRTQRDFHHAKTSNGLGYTSDNISSDLGAILHREAEKKNIYCQCIRCREVKDEVIDLKDMIFVYKQFIASGATEYFISAEIPQPHRNLLLGFVRLRFDTGDKNIPELSHNHVMIRELHVYGRVCPVDTIDTQQYGHVQHRGIGKGLLRRAEWLAMIRFFPRIYIISGIGVRNYYKKRGYILQGTYMVKNLSHYYIFTIGFLLISLLLFILMTQQCGIA